MEKENLSLFQTRKNNAKMKAIFYWVVRMIGVAILGLQSSVPYSNRIPPHTLLHNHQKGFKSQLSINRFHTVGLELPSHFIFPVFNFNFPFCAAALTTPLSRNGWNGDASSQTLTLASPSFSIRHSQIKSCVFLYVLPKSDSPSRKP